jgi:hypothetical protein
MFTVMFAIGRLRAGSPSGRKILMTRSNNPPRQIYIGKNQADYLPGVAKKHEHLLIFSYFYTAPWPPVALAARVGLRAPQCHCPEGCGQRISRV